MTTPTEILLREADALAASEYVRVRAPTWVLRDLLALVREQRAEIARLTTPRPMEEAPEARQVLVLRRAGWRVMIAPKGGSGFWVQPSGERRLVDGECLLSWLPLPPVPEVPR